MTNEEINALTDQQINVMVTASVYGLSDFYESGVFTKGKNKRDVTIDSVMTELYLSYPELMMPIVFEDGISLSPTRESSGEMTWTAGYFMGRVVTKFNHANPLRAAAIVYLKMKGVL
ncbi:MAG: hypothetical protein ACRC8W_02680 [Plesiomonas shigelloides]